MSLSASPLVRLIPEQQVVRPGDSPSIRCEVTQGDQPITIAWTRQGKAGLPLTVSQSGDLLQFLNIAVSDEGEYVCTASNAAGQSEAVAKVMVDRQPGGREDSSVVEGGTVELPCRLSPASDLAWRREGGTLPPSASQVGNMLRLENVSVADSGRYVCSSSGRFQYVTLLVERRGISGGPASPARPARRPNISVVASPRYPALGDTLDLRCEVTGAGRDYRVTWSRLGQDSLGENVVARADMMRFLSLERSNKGLYRCSVTTQYGTPYADYNLSVSGSPR